MISKRKEAADWSIVLVVGGLLVCGACSTEIPEHGGTFGTDGISGDTDTDTGPAPVAECWPEEGLTNAVRYECQGSGEGSLTYRKCNQLNGDCPSTSDDVDISFPATSDSDPDDPLAEACCEDDADPSNVEDACIQDCARGACNFVIAELEDEIASDPPFGCNPACEGRRNRSLQAWVDFLRENYDACLALVDNPGSTLELPNVADNEGLGATFNGVLEYECDLTTAAVETSTMCTEAENPESTQPAGTEWECNISGTATLADGTSSDTTPVQGVVRYRRGDCSSSPCWFQIDDLDLTATDYDSGGYMLEDGEAQLLYPTFGDYELTSQQKGYAAEGALALSVGAIANQPGSSLQSYTFDAFNGSETEFQIKKGFFKVKDAEFSWTTGETMTVTASGSSCTFLGFTSG